MAKKQIQFYGTHWCPDCQRAKKILKTHHVKYEYIDIDENEGAAKEVEKINQGRRVIPTIIFPEGDVLVEPSNEELLGRIGAGKKKDKIKHRRLIIVGGGPAGLTTAIYTTREGIQTTVIERQTLGGQAAITDQIDNYPGFPEGVKGPKLSEDLGKQAQRFGAEIIQPLGVKSLRRNDACLEVLTEKHTYHAEAVVIATGVDYKRLGAPGEEKLTGRGVHYCATCDGPFYKGKRLAIVGGGDSAAQESIFLSEIADHLTLLVRSRIKATKILADKLFQLEKRGKMTILYHLEVKEFQGDQVLKNVRTINNQTGEKNDLDVDGVFVFIGLVPNSKFLKGSLELDPGGFVASHGVLKTSLEGVFVAGDVRSGATRQIASAVGEGATAALQVREYLENRG